MKIGYAITRADAVGGASIHVRDLARAMLERGDDVRVFIGGTGPVTDLLAAAGVPFEPLVYLQRALRPARDRAAYDELKLALKAWRPDLLSAHTAKAGWLGRAVGRALHIPTIYTPHGLAIGDRISAAQGIVFTLAERIAAPWAQAIVCVSEAERQLALDKRIARPEQLYVIRNGVRDVQERADPSRSPVRLISVARLEAPKDPATLFAALGRLLDRDWRLDLVGEGPLSGQLEKQAEALGISSRIRFLGYDPNTAARLEQAQIFVLSTRSEGLPRSILEAMRAGLPVIASRVGGIPEFRSVQTVDPGEPDMLAESLRWLIDSPEERAHLGSASRGEYEERFRFERTLAETEALYQKVTASA